jgi:hypothetical protein
VDRRAALALNWLDRARLSADAQVAMLFDFFALEAILGFKSEEKKALGIAFRRTVLGHAVSGEFSAPEMVYFLYEEVRSSAVHGSEALEVDHSALVSFDWSVRRALNEFLEFAEANTCMRRSQVLQRLHGHPDAGRILEWLRERDGRWNEFEIPSAI